MELMEELCVFEREQLCKGRDLKIYNKLMSLHITPKEKLEIHLSPEKKKQWEAPLTFVVEDTIEKLVSSSPKDPVNSIGSVDASGSVAYTSPVPPTPVPIPFIPVPPIPVPKGIKTCAHTNFKEGPKGHYCTECGEPVMTEAEKRLLARYGVIR